MEPDCGSRYDFGLVHSTEALSCISSPRQKTLHHSLDTTLHFTTIVNDKECTVYFIFRPFRRECNLTYHEYEIQCWIPVGTVDKQPIIEIAQRLYEVYFSQNAGYKLQLLRSE